MAKPSLFRRRNQAGPVGRENEPGARAALAPVSCIVEGKGVDGTRFDHLSRRVAGARSRRQLLKAIAGIAAGALTGSTAAAAQTCTAQYSSCSGDEQCCPGSVCEYGLCMPGCRIEGVFTSAWMSPPDNPCAQCLPEVSTTTLTPANEGMSCWSGDPAAGATYCQNGSCSPNNPATCPPPPPCYTDQLVDPASCTYAPAAAGTLCGAGPMCHGGFAQPADACDGNGFCVGGGSQAVDCAPYGCQGDHCATACETDGDCLGGTTCCEGICVSLGTVENCGTCGNGCPSDDCTDPVCSSGSCGNVPANEAGACTTSSGGAGTCQTGTCVPTCAPPGGHCTINTFIQDCCHAPNGSVGCFFPNGDPQNGICFI